MHIGISVPLPAYALADPLGCDGRAIITAIVLAYEIFSRLPDQVVAGAGGCDQGMFSVIGAACAAGKVLCSSQKQVRHATALAVVPNLPLGVTRVGELSMWKGCATASAHARRRPPRIGSVGHDWSSRAV